jgi:di/tricarboxylate transporter
VRRFGDVLLVQGRREDIEHLAADGHLLVLGDVSGRRQPEGKKRWAVLAFLLFVVMTLPHPLKLPISVSVLLGVVVLLATRTVRPHELYGLIEWRLLVLIGGMMSFGVAMEKTGTDVVLAGFFLLTVALTQPMSNQAAALVVLPVAIQTALSLGLNPRTFAVAVTYAASCSFLTPLEPACVLVYAPGRYRFMDFVKIGSLLTVAVFVVVMVLVPVFWPLQ